MATQYIKSKKYTGVSYRKTATDTIYYCSYKTKAGNYSRFKVGYRSAGCTEKMAYEYMQQQKQRIRLGEDDRYTKKRILSLEEGAKLYFEYLRLKQASDHKNSRNKFFNHVIGYFGRKTPLDDITSTQIHEYKLLKLKTHAPATVAMHISILSSIYNHVIKEHIPHLKNPARGIEKSIHVDNARERYLSTKEIELLLEVLRTNKYNNKPHIASLLLLFVKFALSTGARASSILNIKRNDIDLSTRAVQLYDTKNKSWYTGFLHSKLFTQEDIEFIDAQPKYRYIFWNKNRQLTHRIVMYHMRPIYNDLFNQGLDKNDAKNRVCNHTLRHTFASHLTINQVPLFEIQKLLNHKDIKMTLRYMKLAEANKVSAVERLYKE